MPRTITIDLDEQTHRRLAKKAHAEGTSVEALLKTLAHEAVQRAGEETKTQREGQVQSRAEATEPTASRYANMTKDELLDELPPGTRELAENGTQPITPKPLDDDMKRWLRGMVEKHA